MAVVEAIPGRAMRNGGSVVLVAWLGVFWFIGVRSLAIVNGEAC